jgi:hypothetical protein
MSKANEVAASQSGWLDNWFTALAKSPDMKVRANVAIALAILGGEHRVGQFVDVVGDTALDMIRGQEGAAEAIDTVVTGTAGKIDAQTLAAVFRQRRSRGGAAFDAARALLTPAHPIVAWWRLRRVNARSKWWPTLLNAVQATAAAAVILLVLLWALTDRTATLDVLAPEGLSNLWAIAFLAGIALVIAYASARLAVSGIGTRLGLMADGLLSGLLAASPAGLLAGLTYFSPDDSNHSRVRYGALFGMLVLATAAIRMFVGAARPGQWRTATILSAISLPVLFVTTAALLSAYLYRDSDQPVVGAAWFIFVVFAPVYAVCVERSDRLRVARAKPFAPVFRPPPWLILAPVLLLAAPVAARMFVHRESIDVTANQMNGPLKVTSDTRFRINLKGRQANSKPLQLDFALFTPTKRPGFEVGRQVLEKSEDPDSDLSLPPRVSAASAAAEARAMADRNAAEAAAADASAAASDASTSKPQGPKPAEFTLKEPGITAVVDPQRLQSLCVIGPGNSHCGMKAEFANWLQVIAGNTGQALPKAVELYVSAGPPPAATDIVIPPMVPRGPKPAAAPVSLLSTSPTKVLRLSPLADGIAHLTLDPADRTRGRTIIVQQEEPPNGARFTAWWSASPDEAVDVSLKGGTKYLLCVRTSVDVFLDCQHDDPGLHAPTVGLSLSPPSTYDPFAGQTAAGQPTPPKPKPKSKVPKA